MWRRRAAVARSGQQNAAMLHEWPHFLLPFLLHLLAHHPDFPVRRCLEAALRGLASVMLVNERLAPALVGFAARPSQPRVIQVVRV